MNIEEILARLQREANPGNVTGMAHFGINPENTLGISMPALRQLAREAGKDHALAQELWASGIHEARILAALVDDPRQVTLEQLDTWARQFDSWDVCDQVCGNLFDRTPWAYQKAAEWGHDEAEFMKRAAFALIASLAVHDKKAPDTRFEPFFPLILEASTDPRNFVKKAVNWALRGLGKRNRSLHARAIETARAMQKLDDRTARWNAADTLRELTDPKHLARIPE